MYISELFQHYLHSIFYAFLIVSPLKLQILENVILKHLGTSLLSLFFCILLAFSITHGQTPQISVDGITATQVIDLGSGFIRLVKNPATDDLYILKPDEGIYSLTIEPEVDIRRIASNVQIGGEATGMAFDVDGNVYTVLNFTIDDTHNKGVIRKGVLEDNGRFRWHNVASTEAYPRSNTIFNHNYNGIVVSPDGAWLYVNAGSRTDHGELQDFDGLFPDAREVPLTTKIFKIPSGGKDITLVNDEAALVEDGYIYAWGVRNAYDLAFAPNGELFAIDNGPDADYPEELNWIREGHHYGFPWKFGDWDNRQQFADYDSKADELQHPDFTAVQEGYYQNDPSFPPPSTEFTKPIANLGPDAMVYRALDGSEVNAAEKGETLYTFTPHRSPLGIVFVDNDTIPSNWQSNEESLSAFVLSWGAAGGSLSDRGMDVLHMRLSKTEDNYESVTTQIATEFRNPIDAAVVGNTLYVLEWGADGGVWALEFEE